MLHRFGSPPFRSANRATHHLWRKTLITILSRALSLVWHRSNGRDGARPAVSVSFNSPALPFSSAERRERSPRWSSATCLRTNADWASFAGIAVLVNAEREPVRAQWGCYESDEREVLREIFYVSKAEGGAIVGLWRRPITRLTCEPGRPRHVDSKLCERMESEVALG